MLGDQIAGETGKIAAMRVFGCKGTQSLGFCPHTRESFGNRLPGPHYVHVRSSAGRSHLRRRSGRVSDCGRHGGMEGLGTGKFNPGGGASVVRHSDATLWRERRARVTFSRMSEAFAVQMKGLGVLL